MGEKETISGSETGVGRESGAASAGELTPRDLAAGQASGRRAAPEVADDGPGDGGPEPVDTAVVKSKSNISNN